MSFSYPPSCSENAYPSILTNSSDGDRRVAQRGWGPSSFVSNLDTPLMSEDAAHTNFQHSHSGGSLEGLDGSTSTVVRMSQDVNTVRSQQGSVLADDECFIRRRSEGEPPKEWTVLFIFDVIRGLMDGVLRYRCLVLEELWLRLIEGDVDDDVWLWVDGDEEWLRSEEPDWHSSHDPYLSENLASAQSALRRRVAQQRCPPATARNQRVRSATPGQRLAVIVWLIASSKEVAELLTSHGCTPPTFRTPHIASLLDRIVGKYWDGFSSETSAWEKTIAKAKEDGCICSPADCRGMQRWFNMIVWLEGKPPILEVGYKSCERCRSLVRSWYKDITTEHTVILDVSLLEAFFSYCSDCCGLEDHAHYRLSPTATRMMDEKLEPLMKEHTLDMRYLPCVNKYPHPLRKHVAHLSCAPPDVSFWELEDVEVPDNILDGAHDPWEVLGLIAMVAFGGPCYTGTDLHDQRWHSYFSSFLRTFLTCFDMPVLPRLSSTSVRLCHELDQGYSEECLFSMCSVGDDLDWAPSDQDGRHLCHSTVVFVAVAIFLRSNEISVSICRKCRTICMKSSADTSSSAGFEVIDSGNDTQGGSMSLVTWRLL
ncbi:hypothetical protein BKA82DRAFT_997035 [Pisolithus tinctorius]|uniref:Uncharacterized protein n=1 Tax=Pisolithus tinctorius Marx 270 TaxID=870435 RepID=A0A0C3P6D4_PISTI|nr:hypothetical protein BKA82DRAFT_997035 [Pisolithus tinctorius]KIO08835.1 hypothetical protein M404DRAFT_997035 [Pisolithus tinctorius Marx 270]